MLERMQILVIHTWFPIRTFQFTTYKVFEENVLKFLSSNFTTFECEVNDSYHIVLKIKLNNDTNL